MKDFNNTFELIYHDENGNETEKLTYQLTEGNPNVNDVKANLNNLLKLSIHTKFN